MVGCKIDKLGPIKGKPMTFMSRRVAIILSVLTLLLYAAYILSGSAEFLYQWSKSFASYEVRQHLGLSKRFLLQYGHIVFLFLLLYFSRFIFIEDKSFKLPERFLSVIAKYTPAVFLFHFPLLYFTAAITDHDPNNDLEQIFLLSVVMALSISLGKMCFYFKPTFDTLYGKIAGYLSVKYPPTTLPKTAQTEFQLTNAHSRFLNFVKILSMGAVVLGHFSFKEFTVYTLPGFDGSAPRFAVPVFFMLSGYFLSLSIDRTTLSAPVMFLKRAWSLYYIIVPMLVIVPLLDLIGYSAGAEIYHYQDYYVSERERGPLGAPVFLATWFNSLLYLNEIWIFTLAGMSDMKGAVVAFSNDPYWFMCYLLPFTLLLIVWRMVQGIKRYLGLFLVCLIVGPPVLLLSPLFFAGTIAHQLHKRHN
jgi:Acyltransferase family